MFVYILLVQLPNSGQLLQLAVACLNAVLNEKWQSQNYLKEKSPNGTNGCYKSNSVAKKVFEWPKKIPLQSRIVRYLHVFAFCNSQKAAAYCGKKVEGKVEKCFFSSWHPLQTAGTKVHDKQHFETIDHFVTPIFVLTMATHSSCDKWAAPSSLILCIFLVFGDRQKKKCYYLIRSSKAIPQWMDEDDDDVRR